MHKNIEKVTKMSYNIKQRCFEKSYANTTLKKYSKKKEKCNKNVIKK